MVPVTRFNPSVNGSLHLGHLYTALVNEGMSSDLGGKLYVRFDDTSAQHVVVFGAERMARTRAGQQEELEWLGLRTDGYLGQTEALPEVHAFIKKHMDLPPADPSNLYQPELVMDSYFPLFPCSPMLTAEKVVFDHMLGVNLLIRGMDLITEYSLYQYFCDRFNFPRIRHIYLPRLSWAGGDMSKRFGGMFISVLRADGHTPDEVRGMVAAAALRNPSNGWTMQNLRGNPRI